MKNHLFKPVMLISIFIGICFFSCKPDVFTEEEAILLQNKLEKETLLLKDSLNSNLESVTYTISLVDASTATLSKGESESKSISGAIVSLTQKGITVSKTTTETGLLTFSKLQKGLAALSITMTGYSDVKAVIDLSNFGIDISVPGGIQYGNIIPMIPITGTTTGTIKGTVYCETDLTNLTPEPVPAGTKVIATVDPHSPALASISSATIQSISYDKLSLIASTDASGSFTMTVPGTSMGLDYELKVSDFQANQSLLMETKNGLPVTGVQSIATSFGSSFSSGSSQIPDVSPVIISIGAPDYTFTAATATAVVSNLNGLDYILKTSSGDYYVPNTTFTNIIVDNPTPGVNGSNAYFDFTTNSYGQVTSTTIYTKGSGYPTSAENSTFSLPYIKTPAKAVVLTVNGTGGITSWKVLTSGQFFSMSNIEFVRSSGSGIGAILPLPSIYNSGSSLYFTTSAQYPPSPLGSGYAVNDEFTLAVKNGLSNPMVGKIHMTTGTVSSINVVNEGSNYISGRVDVTIASPGSTGTTALASATVSNGKIASINVSNGGSNYVTAPTVTISNKVTKIQAKASATVNSTGTITSCQVTGGDGYISVPAVTVTPSLSGIGSGASLLAVVSSARVSSLNIINGGIDYTAYNRPDVSQNAPTSINAKVMGSGTTIITINLGTGKRSIED